MAGTEAATSVMGELTYLTTDWLAGAVSARTQIAYGDALRRFEAFRGDRELCAATLGEWRDSLVAAGYAASSINLSLSAIKSLARMGYRRGLVAWEVYTQLKNVEPARERALRDRRKKRAKVEARQITASVDTLGDELRDIRDRAIILVLSTSGMRAQELCTLSLGDVRDGGCYVLGKTDIEPRLVPLASEARTAILEWLAARTVAGETLFTAFERNGQTLTAQALTPNSVWRIVKGRVGVNPHALRRFVGTALARTSLRMAQQALGHADLRTTAKHYLMDTVDTAATESILRG